MKTSLKYLISISLISLFLTGCGVQPTDKSSRTPEPGGEPTQLQSILDQASRANSPEKETLQLKAAQLLIEQQQYEFSGELLAAISRETLPLNEQIRWQLLNARTLLGVGEAESALQQLEQEQLVSSLVYAPTELQIEASVARADVFNRLGKHIASAQERIYISPLLNDEERQKASQATWDSLMYVSAEELSHYLGTAVSGDYRGWLHLALIAKDNLSDIDEQIQQLDLWQSRWPLHPANSSLPDELVLLRELAANRAKQVALLVPLSGKLSAYGKAVRDGFLASFYEQKSRGRPVPTLKIYDTELEGDIYSIYQRAIDDGAQTVVGPLDKNRLAELLSLPSLPVQTLALNRTSTGLPLPELAYQFGLSPIDEARQNAEIAFVDGHERALIVAPEGNWGRQVAAAFVDEWELLGGEVAGFSTFDELKNYSTTISNALNIDSSEQRKKSLFNLLQQPIEFQPRRRQDIDMVFLLARAREARSIKPMLDFHYAADLPVYATSRTFSGAADPLRDRDLNKIRFTDIPWILSPSTAIAKQIESELPDSKNYRRMYALGVDAFQIYPRLRQLDALPGSRLFGQTGILRLNQQRELQRESMQAEFRNGKPRLLPSTNISSTLPYASKERSHVEKKAIPIR